MLFTFALSSIILMALIALAVFSPASWLEIDVSAGVECSVSARVGKPMLIQAMNACMGGVFTEWDRDARSLDIRVWGTSDCSGPAPHVHWHFDSAGVRLPQDPTGLCMIGFQHVAALNHTVLPLSAMTSQHHSGALAWASVLLWVAAIFFMAAVSAQCRNR